jgi:hypothetical protein
MHTFNQDLVPLDLSFEALETLEAPMSDTEAGVIVGISFGLGLVVGALLVT